jgi:hypothetical protein
MAVSVTYTESVTIRLLHDDQLGIYHAVSTIVRRGDFLQIAATLIPC